jgi:cell division septation protein DedD
METIKDFFNEVPGKNIAETKTDTKVKPKLAEPDINKDKESQIAIDDSKEDSAEAEVFAEDTIDNTASENDVMDEEVAKVEVVEKEPKTEPEVVINKTEGPQYYVIAGCFRSEFKANRLLNDLQSKGFENASIEGKTPNGLIRVCYATYPKRHQASNYMLKLQNQGRKGVWIQKGN